MSDETPRPDADKTEEADNTAAEPAPAAPTVAAAAAAPAAPTLAAAAAAPAAVAVPATGRWWNRRVPLAITGAALLLGCVLGAGVAAVGAFVGDSLHGDNRGHSDRVQRGGNENGNWNGDRHSGRGNRQNQGNPPAPSNSSAPSAGASAPVPSPTVSS